MFPETLSIEEGFLLEGVNENKKYMSLRSCGQFLLSLTDYGFDIYNHDINEIDQLMTEEVKETKLFELFVIESGRFVVALANSNSLQVLYFFQPREGMFYTSLTLLALPISKKPLKIQWDQFGVLYVLYEESHEIVRYKLVVPQKGESDSPSEKNGEEEPSSPLDMHHNHKIVKEKSLKLDEDIRKGFLTDFALLSVHDMICVLADSRYTTLIKLNSLNLKQCDILKNEPPKTSIVSVKALSALGLSQMQASLKETFLHSDRPLSSKTTHLFFVEKTLKLIVNEKSSDKNKWVFSQQTSAQ